MRLRALMAGRVWVMLSGQGAVHAQMMPRRAPRCSGLGRDVPEVSMRAYTSLSRRVLSVPGIELQ